jgi:K+-sensing histidine kinase KdpD
MESWLWQIAFGVIVASLLYWEQLSAWVRALVQRKRAFPLGYLFATGYAILGVLILEVTFTARPLPRFEEIFLAGIAITSYFFTITAAAYLLAISVAVAAWILPPVGSFAIASPADCYRVLSFAAVSGLLILLTGRLKKWSSQNRGALPEN